MNNQLQKGSLINDVIRKNGQGFCVGREIYLVKSITMGESSAVVPKLFLCADHLESFGGPRSTKY